MITDFRLAYRSLRKSPGFALAALSALALGIGANTAIFSLVNQLLLRPPGIADPESVVTARVRYDKLNLTSIGISAPDFADVRDARAVFKHAAISDGGDFNYTGGNVPERLQGANVSAEWFDVFGVTPLLGRTFLPEEDQPGANNVVVLAHPAWQRLFGGDPGVVGKTIDLNQKPYRIVGVMSRDFRWPRQVDVWAPLGLPAEALQRERASTNDTGPLPACSRESHSHRATPRSKSSLIESGTTAHRVANMPRTLRGVCSRFP